jgi:hypothetical protein
MHFIDAHSAIDVLKINRSLLMKTFDKTIYDLTFA